MSARRKKLLQPSSEAKALSTGMLMALSDHDLADLVVTPPSPEHPSGSRFDSDDWIWPPSNETEAGRLSKRSLKFSGLRGQPQNISWMKRYVLLCMLFPIKRYRDLPSLKKRVDYCTKVIGRVQGGNEAGGFHAAGHAEFFAAFESVCGNLGLQTRRCVATYFIEANSYYHKGQLPAGLSSSTEDWLSDVRIGKDFDGTLPERPISSQEDDFGRYRPLPDGFISEAGCRWIFYIEEVFPNLLQCFAMNAEIELAARKRRKVWRGRKGALSGASVSKNRAELWKDALQGLRMLGSTGSTITRIPFTAPVSVELTSYVELLNLFDVCQSSLLQLLLLLTGGRSGEIESLTRNCLHQGDDESLHGRTYKLSGLRAGAKRDWPIPERIARAIGIQIKIAELLSPGRTGLWVTTGTVRRFEGPIAAFYQIGKFVEGHELAAHSDERNPHPHRFRKSIARLAVACLAGAPAILRQIFGHADIEVTLDYILSDPAIRELLAELAEEGHISLAKSIGMDIDECGGKGAIRLRKLRDEFLQAAFIPENERQQRRTMDEFVSAKLGSADVDLKMIFPGVVCIRQPGQDGRCGRGGQINAAECQTECPHYVALPSGKGDTEARIRWLAAEVQKPKIRKNELLRPWYRAQLEDQLDVFPDLGERLRTDPLVQSALEGRCDA